MFRLAIVLLSFSAIAQCAERVPVIVELFTSEGCSSCPSADRLLADLEHNQPIKNAEIIVLSEHVDYWNSLGWKDPFSSSLFSARQQFYANLMHSSDVYTPQAVVDGRFSAVGSNRQQLLRAAESSVSRPKPDLQLQVEREGDGVLVDSVRPQHGTVWIAITQAKAVSHVSHGENGGQTLQHAGVVRYLAKATAGATRIKLDPDWGSDLRVVAFVQDASSGSILQAVQKAL